jgi:hypothetical protein
MGWKGYRCRNCSIEFLANSWKIGYCPSCSQKNFESSGAVYEDEALLGMPVGEDAFFVNTRKFLIMDEETPDDILGRSALMDNYLVYIPAYKYTVKYEAYWSAQCGYDRTETYTEWRYDHQRNTSVPHTASRTVTDWRHTEGRVAEDKAEILSSAARVSGIGELAVKSGIIDFKGERAEPEKVLLEKCVKTDQEVFAADGIKKLENKISSRAWRDVPSNKVRNFKIDRYTYDVFEIIRVYLPIWAGLYNYKRDMYRVCCGADGKTGGFNTPVDEKRKKMLWRVRTLFKWAIGINILAWAVYAAFLFFQPNNTFIAVMFILVSLVFLAAAGIGGEIFRKICLYKSRRLKLQSSPPPREKVVLPRDFSGVMKIFLTAAVAGAEFFIWWRFWGHLCESFWDSLRLHFLLAI